MRKEISDGETLRRLAEQAKRLQNRPATSTLWRWANKGIRGIFLETVQIGGVTYCSDEALARFLRAINEQADRAKSAPRSGRERCDSVKKAEAILAKAGI